MNLYLMIAIVIANAMAIGIVYQFIKRLQNKEKLIIIAVSIALMYILVSITYWISGFGINKEIHEQAKNFITHLFVPVNVILFIPYMTLQYMKLKENQIKQEKFLKRAIVVIVLLIVVLVIEYFYFRNIQNNIIKITDKVEQENTIEQNEISNEMLNIIDGNQIENEYILNEEALNQID